MALATAGWARPSDGTVRVWGPCGQTGARPALLGARGDPMATIDLNSDVGERFGRWTLGDDAAMLTVVSSANIACGYHAGDPRGIRQTLQAAAANGVSVGAHVGYRDLAGFGRRDLDVASDDLAAETIYQIGALRALAASVGTTVRYVKPRGEPGAVLHDPALIAERILGLVRTGRITAVDGSEIELNADSVCVHGDTE